ncbi:cellulose biosynthesis protein BcsO [Erwinia sp. V71]|uniref:cellulose biosynthesis protein BcsO n=1 Tax=Erwinia sp. V71 TaxID=3369424 RepID=UPI003F5D64AD
MKSYDDLQRFKEKTQTNNIKFKDMSGQTLESGTTNWAIIKQLLNDNKNDSALERGQSIDLIQPQPIEKGEFAQPKSAHEVVRTFVTAPSVGKQGGSLYDSIAATLKSAPEHAPAASHASEPASATPAVAPLLQQTASQLTHVVPDTAITPTVSPLLQQAAAQLAPAAEQVQPTSAATAEERAARYRQLFNARHTPAAQMAAGMTKETLLKPLLEKIALCR